MNYWIWFATIKGLGSVQKRKLLEIYDTPEKIYNAKIKSLESTNVLRKSVLEEFERSKDKILIRKYQEYIEKHEISLININDSYYPEILKEIYDPPITLFSKGDINLLKY